MQVRQYNEHDRAAWDKLIDGSRNGTFLLQRAYMEYHADRFDDCSLLFYNDRGVLVALMPANRVGEVLYAHQGLTYGGLVMHETLYTADLFALFDALKHWMREHGLTACYYKRIPAIYHCTPCDEELYALRSHGAVLEQQQLSMACSGHRLAYNSNRKRGVKKANRAGCTVVETTDLSSFWSVLSDNLQATYGAKPVHSLDEIYYLKQQFEQAIRCFVCMDASGSVQAGVLVYETPTCAHFQYISASAQGKELGALDFLIDELLQSVFPNKAWVDFGTSQDASTATQLNEGLIHQKEGFGARGIVYETYLLKI